MCKFVSDLSKSLKDQLSGVTVIRAFSQQDSFLDRLSSTIDVQNVSWSVETMSECGSDKRSKHMSSRWVC